MAGQEAYTSIRINRNKKPGDYLFPLEDPVPWSESGYYLAERPSFTFDPLFHAGAYYVQEPSSMLVGHVVRQLPRHEEMKVLDLCGAPGGKSTLLASALGNHDVLVTNEVIRSRYMVLVENMTKWGLPNVILTNHDPRDFQRLGPVFDLVLVDAPCSGEGLWRKDARAAEQWSEENVRHCSLRQRRILADILPALKPGGFLVYATCTFNDMENIDNVDWMVRTFGLWSVQTRINEDWGLQRKAKGDASGYQASPEFTRGEGFFFSVLQKPDDIIVQYSAKKKRRSPGNWEPVKTPPEVMPYLANPQEFSCFRHPDNSLFACPSETRPFLEDILDALPRSRPLLELGQIKKTTLIPAHALAVSASISEQVPRIEVDIEQAVRYLQRSEQITVPQGTKPGWYLLTFRDVPLGWIKNLGNRIKNHFPMPWRIKKQVT